MKGLVTHHSPVKSGESLVVLCVCVCVCVCKGGGGFIARAILPQYYTPVSSIKCSNH